MSDTLDRSDFMRSYIRGKFFQVMKRLTKKKYKRAKYYEKTIFDIADGTEKLKEIVMANRPGMIGRFGTSEVNAFVRYLQIRMGIRNSFNENIKKELCFNAGFFPATDMEIVRYCELMEEVYPLVDLLGLMNSLGEDFVVKHFCKDALLTRLQVVDPIFTGWTDALEGQRVLVIHPFAKTIEKQFRNNRTEIHSGANILPEFELQTISAVQTIAGTTDPRFANWFEALDYMTQEASGKKFDIALIGAGAYGFPLACRVKQMGHTAVHMGGCLQLLFGIIGRRWKSRPQMQGIINENWVRPSPEDIPKRAEKVEDGCYW